MSIITSVEDEIQKYDEYYLNSDLSNIYKQNRNKLIEIIGTFYSIQNKKNIDENDLKVIRNGICESWSVIFHDCTGKYISQFEPDYQLLTDLIEELCNSTKWNVRKNIIIISPMFKNIGLKNSIILKGLEDKSSRCREYAFDRILYVDNKKATEQIRKMIDGEIDDKSRWKLNHINELLENGFSVLKNDGKFITIQNRYSTYCIPVIQYDGMSKIDIINKNKKDA